ncbi:major facilitator superfamily domain-containing protein, partial [Jimgerdemannia flammicorona]
MPFIIQGIYSGVGYDPNIDPYIVSENSASTARDTGILLAAYAVGLLGGSPVFGIMGDRTLTRRFPMLMGMLGMILSTIVLMFANYYWLLLIARFAQGISAACIWTLGLSLVADIIPASELGVEMGKVMVSYSVGMLAGPPIGGGPRAPFIFCTIIAMTDFIFRLLVVEKRNAPKEWFDNDDVEKAGTLSASEISEKINVPTEKSGISATALDTVIGADNANENKLETAATSAASGTLARQEVQTLRLIMNPRMISALIVTIVNSFLYGALEPTVTLRLATEWGLNTGSIGLVFIAHVVPGFICGPGAGWVSDKYGPRIVVLVSMILTALCTILLALPNKDTGLWPLIVGLVLIGGVGAAFLSPVLAEIAAVVNMQGGREGDGFARSYAIFNMAF